MLRDDEIRRLKHRANRASFRDTEAFKTEILAIARELIAEDVAAMRRYSYTPGADPAVDMVVDRAMELIASGMSLGAAILTAVEEEDARALA